MKPNTFDWEGLDRAFRESISVLDGQEPDWWAAWHRYLAELEEARWHWTPEAAPAFFGRNWPSLADRWVRRARHLADEGLGYGEYQVQYLANGQIDWGANPKRTMNWNTFHNWTWAWPIVFAYAYTHEERFVEAFRDCLESYFEQFDTFTPALWKGADPTRIPEPYSDWRDRTNFNSLGIGHRSQVMNAAATVFRRSQTWRPEDLRRANLLVVRMMRRLYDDFAGRNELEMLEAKNFLMTGAAGLGITAGVLRESAWSPPWLDLSKRIFRTLLMALYHGDGGQKELCTQYHNTGLRDLVLAEQILHDLPGGFLLDEEPFRGKFLGMLKFTAGLIAPDGHTAALNSAHYANDWIVLFTATHRFLRDPELAWHLQRWRRPATVPHQKSVPSLQCYVMGERDELEGEALGEQPELCSQVFRDSGVAVLRDGWDRQANMMVLDFGRCIGGHAYPARSSFSLWLGGRPAALSPGSYVDYSHPLYRGWCHTTRSQNTVWVDDLDQEQWVTPGEERVQGEIVQWEDDADAVLVQGRHDGYLPNAGIRHVRTVMMTGGMFIVHDVIDATQARESHSGRWSLHCPEPWSAADDGSGAMAAPGLMRVVPFWPETIAAVETGSEGIAAYPGISEDGMTGAYRRLNQMRYRFAIEKGSVTHFAAVISADREDENDGLEITRAEVGEEGLRVRVKTNGVERGYELG